jgi:capsular exopolysaccharide synthesis family protein
MTDLTPVRVDASQSVARSTGVPGTPDAPLWGSSSREDVNSAGAGRAIYRHAAMIALCGVVAGGAGFLVAARRIRLFESSISIRVYPQVAGSASSAPNAAAIRTTVPTEIEMLRSRALARQVVDSTAFRLQVTGSNGTERMHPPRSTIMTDVHVGDDAPTNTYRLTRAATGGDLELWRASDEELIATVPAGGVVRLRGLSFRLSTEVVSLAPVEFAVLSLDDAVESVQAWTTVTRRRPDADLIDVRVRGPDPVLVHDVADAFGRLYIASHVDTRSPDAEHSVKILRDQLARVSRQLRVAEQALRSYRARGGVNNRRKELHQADLERAVNKSRSLYAMLQDRLREAEIGATAADERVRLVDGAVLPRRPVSPEPLRSALFAVAAGLAAGVAVALLRELRDRSLRTREQLLALTSSPVVSLIPHLQGRRGRKGNAIAHSPDSPAAAKYAVNDLHSFAQSYTRLVTKLGFGGNSQQIRVLLVTSALPGDGKTTVATNLSLTLAREGKRVLLIDADLRGGQIAGMMRLPSTSGFGEALMQQTDLTNVVSQVFAGERCILHVLSRGRSMIADPAAVLASDAPRELLAHARGMFEMIVIDSPAVTGAADAALLSRHCDGVLVVARASTTARSALKFAMEQLHIARAPVVGAVLNDVDLRRDAGVDAAYQFYGQYPSGSPA